MNMQKASNSGYFARVNRDSRAPNNRLGEPSTRMARNDARVLEPGIAQLAEVGWGGLAVSTIAKRAGVSQQTIQVRFRNRTATANGLWEHTLKQPMERALELLLKQLGLLNYEPGKTIPLDEAARRHAR